MAKLITMVMMIVLVVCTTIRLTEAQTPDCASKLIPCVDYLNSTTKPPASCCDPIKEAVRTQRECLCNLYSTPGLLATFNVTVPDALRLTKNCGVTTDLTACNSKKTPSPTSSPGVPGNDGGRITSSGIGSLFLVFASMMFY